MAFFKLLHGMHSEGVGVDQKFYRARPSTDPNAVDHGNVVESEEDLAAIDPARWALTTEQPKKMPKAGAKTNARGEPLPPRPSPEGAALAAITTPSSAEEQEILAEQLEAKAKELRDAAAETKKTAAKSAKSAKSAKKGAAEEDDKDKEEDLGTKSLADLKKVAKEEGVTGYSGMTKDELVEAIGNARTEAAEKGDEKDEDEEE